MASSAGWKGAGAYNHSPPDDRLYPFAFQNVSANLIMFSSPVQSHHIQYIISAYTLNLHFRFIERVHWWVHLGTLVRHPGGRWLWPLANAMMSRANDDYCKKGSFAKHICAKRCDSSRNLDFEKKFTKTFSQNTHASKIFIPTAQKKLPFGRINKFGPRSLRYWPILPPTSRVWS